MDTIEALRRRINEAFSDVPRPVENNIARHECDECEEVRRVFSHLHWRDVDTSIALHNYDKLPLFTPEAHRFFLPAFLLASLSDLEQRTPILEFTVYDLSPDPAQQRELEAWTRERIAPFAPVEREAIVDFLGLVKDDERCSDLSDGVIRGLYFRSARP